MNKPPDLILPAFGRYAEINFTDFARRLQSFNALEARQRSRRKLRAKREEEQKRRELRGFFPQSRAVIGRVDSTPADKARGRVYLTMDNGQVLNPGKLLRRRGANPMLRLRAIEFIEAKVPPGSV